MSISQNVVLPESFYGEKTIVIAKSGYGKSYTARVIIEEGRKLGGTFVVIDPQNAYLNMPDFSYIDATKVKSARSLATLIATSHRNTVIQVRRLSIEDQAKFVKAFMEQFRLSMKRGIQTIVIDEMHKFAPENEKTDAKEIIRGMFQENRSDGLGIIGISQRPQRIDKTCLSQADNLCIGRVTSFRDKEAIRNYIDDPNDLDKIKSLKKGEFYFYGFGFDEPVVEMVRKAETEHSGESPKNLLREDTALYEEHIRKSYSGSKNMSESISTSGEIVNKIVPSSDGFMDMAKIGMKVGLGTAIGGIAGSYVGGMFKSPIPVVSSRTLGAAGTTVVLYAGYRMIKQPLANDILKYAAAGSAAFTLGSLVFDVVGATGVQLPAMVSNALGMATGAKGAQENSSESGSAVDVDTVMG